MLKKLISSIKEKKVDPHYADLATNPAKWEELKLEYKKLSKRKRKTEQQLASYLLLTSCIYLDTTFGLELLNGEAIDPETTASKLGIARFHFMTGKKRIAFLYFAKLIHIEALPERDFSDAIDCAEALGEFEICEQLILKAIKNNPDSNEWKCRALLHQTFVININQKHKSAIKGNLAYVEKRATSPLEYQTLASSYFNLGDVENHNHALNISLQLASFNTIPRTQLDPLFDADNTLKLAQRIRKRLLESDIKAFLTFGTLLGLHRDGCLMAYDKDADLGILIEGHQDLRKLITDLAGDLALTCPSAVFYSDDELSYNAALVDPKTGVVCDLFFFHKYKTGYRTGIYKGQSLLSWYYPTLEIEEIIIDGETYFAPTEINDHLAQTYGPGWQEPIEVWDSLMDCPNLLPSSIDAVGYWCGQRLFVSFIKGHSVKARHYLAGLTEKWPGILTEQTRIHLEASFNSEQH
ncbi:hypothetical protein OAD56_03790 [Gammaproteobacteria bacterium]|nr:hypothetical protein [Gammaproteobacteria bacterium]